MTQVVEDRCLGQTTCMFTVTADLFGGDPCPSSEATKRLAAVLTCGDALTADVRDGSIPLHPDCWLFWVACR